VASNRAVVRATTKEGTKTLTRAAMTKLVVGTGTETRGTTRAAAPRLGRLSSLALSNRIRRVLPTLGTETVDSLLAGSAPAMPIAPRAAARW
jgi:hypothetical protein